MSDGSGGGEGGSGWTRDRSTPTVDPSELATLDVVPQGIAITRAGDGSFLYVNDAAVAALGHPRDALLGGLRAPDLYDRRERRAEVLRAAEGGEVTEVALVTGDGRRVWLLLSLRRIRFGEEPAYLTSIVDVTERLGLEAELRQSRDRLAIVSAMARTIRAGLPPARVAEVAVERTAEVLSEGLRVCCALLDRRGEARVLASNGPDTLPSLEGARVDLSLAPAYFETLSARRPFLTEDALDDARLSDVRGALEPLGCRAFVDAPLFRGDDVVGIFCVASAAPRAWSQHEVRTLAEVAEYLSGAISDAQLYEERLRSQAVERELLHADRLKSIGQLAAGVAHEINNPAAFVTANLEALRSAVRRASRRGNSERVDYREMSRMIQESEVGMHRIASVASQLRAFARVERDEVEATDLNTLVEGACAMVRNEVRARARLEIKLGALPQVSVDPGKISQVLVNLLVNAAQATPEGDAEAHRILVRTGRRRGRVVVTVSDTGVGMDEATQARIFEPFYTTKPRELGTGLGLSLSAEIVRQHGGELEVESAPGQGSSFSLLLPVGHLRPSAPPVLRSAGAGADARRLRILAIDDEELLLRSLRRTLGRRHEVVSAVGGRAGLALLTEPGASFDVVLCDLMMPDLDGQRLYEQVAARDPSLGNRFVFMSGGAFTPRAKEFVARVGRPVVHKPLRPAALEAILRDTAGKP